MYTIYETINETSLLSMIDKQHLCVGMKREKNNRIQFRYDEENKPKTNNHKPYNYIVLECHLN